MDVTRPPREREIFCNRTLNLRGIKAIGYDMDYTLIHYHVEAWERRAYEYLRETLAAQGWPVGHLEFDPGFVIRGLMIDTTLGNIVKADRFGYIKRACHGTAFMEFDAQRVTYARTLVDLRDHRWAFMNTLFSLSEACMYAQLVDLLDARQLPGVLGYADLYAHVRKGLDGAHAEGRLKAEIIARPEAYVDRDPDLPWALLDQKEAGKKLLLITNSEWGYTAAMMAWAFDGLLPRGMGWRDLFDLVIVSARKPTFFSTRSPAFEVVSPDGLLKPIVGPMHLGGTYLGGDAMLVEECLGLSGAEILYVGDHIFADVNVTKNILRWRTALVLRELEAEIAAEASFSEEAATLTRLMAEKVGLEQDLSRLRLRLQRIKHGHDGERVENVEKTFAAMRERTLALDAAVAPLAQKGGELLNPRWGPLMRAGNDKSHLARQVERYADIYTSRVSNFLYATPFTYLRAPRSSLPHDG